jgi:hypothetical protein
MSNKILEARRWRTSKHQAAPLQANNCRSERFRTGIVINFDGIGLPAYNSSAFMARTKKVALTYLHRPSPNKRKTTWATDDRKRLTPLAELSSRHA